jgi:hypothetical protein
LGAAQFGVEAMVLTEHFERNGGDDQLLIAGGDDRQVGSDVGEALPLDVDRDARAVRHSVEERLQQRTVRVLTGARRELLGPPLRIDSRSVSSSGAGSS